MTDDEAAAVVEAADEADPQEAEHDDGSPDDQPGADDLPSPSGLPDPNPEGDDEGTGEDGSESGESDESDDSTAPTTSSGDTMGDLYARMLVNISNGIIEQHGHEDAEKVSVEAAKQAKVDHHFDRLMDEVGMGRDLPPGQAVMLSSAMFVGGSIIAHTDIAEQAVNDLDFGL